MRALDYINTIVKIANDRFLSVREAFPSVYQFYRDIVPEIRKRQLGLSELPEGELKAFDELLNMKFRHVPISKDNGSPGYYPSAWKRFVPFVNERNDYLELDKHGPSEIAAHEMRHALETRIPTDKEAQKKLDGFYGYNRKSIKPGIWGRIYSFFAGNEEAATTNKEHQFALYEKLWRRLNRAPTASEYFDYVGGGKSGLSDEDIRRHLSGPINGYENNSGRDYDFRTMDKSRQDDAIRQFRNLMMSVSRNSNNPQEYFGNNNAAGTMT